MPAVRIIAGRWRGRQVEFAADQASLRPTPDRVRETLFNWLAPIIVGARCLDLFAGSGVLALEALSRGAAHATAVELHAASCRAIIAAAEKFKVQVGHELQMTRQDVLQWLDQETEQSYDIIFLDPPYGTDHALLYKCCAKLTQAGLLKPGAVIYFEHNQAIAENLLPSEWVKLKQQKAGQVHYYLYKNPVNI